jgi:hypothetical protein
MHNRSMRHWAQQCGFALSERALCPAIRADHSVNTNTNNNFEPSSRSAAAALSCRGRSLPANAGGGDTHRDSLTVCLGASGLRRRRALPWQHAGVRGARAHRRRGAPICHLLSPFLAWIGSRCLRRCVHGAPTGGRLRHPGAALQVCLIESCLIEPCVPDNRHGALMCLTPGAALQGAARAREQGAPAGGAEPASYRRRGAQPRARGW